MSSAADDRIAALERRLLRLEDEAAILCTLYRYARALDSGDDDGWMDCFVPNGVMDVIYPEPARGRAEKGTRHDRGVRHVGTEQLLAFKAGHSRPPNLHRHTIAGPAIELDGDRARVESYMVVFGRDERSRALDVSSLGYYHDQLVRCPDGAWRFVERIAEVASSRNHPG